MSRTENQYILTRRLIILTTAALLIVIAVFALTYLNNRRLMISWVVFFCGIIGGFVSIQQRAKDISDEDLDLVCGSWFQILLIPIFGAIFSLVLYCIFLAGLLKGDLFPAFFIPSPPSAGPNDEFIVEVLQRTYPLTGSDLAKLIFWSFAAGFAERFVPQIVSNFTSRNS